MDTALCSNVCTTLTTNKTSFSCSGPYKQRHRIHDTFALKSPFRGIPFSRNISPMMLSYKISNGMSNENCGKGVTVGRYRILLID